MITLGTKGNVRFCVSDSGEGFLEFEPFGKESLIQVRSDEIITGDFVVMSFQEFIGLVSHQIHKIDN